MSKIAIVGVEGSGKTVLMAALGEMYGQMSNDSLYLMPENQAAFAFMTRIPHKMRVERQWPEATAIESMKYLKWTVRIGSEVLAEVDMLDYPGELYRMAFGDRKQEEIEGTKAQIHEFLEHLVTADDLIVLFNLKDAMDIGSNARNNETVWLTRGIFDYAKKLANIKNQLLLFTQADRYSKLLEEVGGAKAAQMKYLPMLTVLHPDLKCAAISAVEASESDAPSLNFENRGLSSLMHRIVLSSEIGRRAKAAFIGYQMTCQHAVRAYKTHHDLYNSVQQLMSAADLGLITTGLVNALYPDAMSRCADIAQKLKHFLTDINSFISAHSEDDLASEHPWHPLLEQYSDRTEYVATIHNLINDYDARKKQREVARLNEMRQNRIVRFGVVAFLLIAVGFIAHSTYDSRVGKLARQTGLPKAICSSALWRNADAQCMVGRAYLWAKDDNENNVKAVNWFNKAEIQGNSKARLWLGYLYATGQGVEKNEADAVKWYRLAADQGNSDAQYYLGYMYEEGLGVFKDESEAAKWYRKAADKGNIFAQANLGIMYENGRDGAMDKAEAVKWKRLSSIKELDLGGGVAMNFVYVGPGKFWMGSENGNTDEKPVREVQITKPYWVGKTEVTWEQMVQIETGGSSIILGDKKLPAEVRSWDYANALCWKLTLAELDRLPPGYVYRLPTEAEWEYAARGGPYQSSHHFAYSGADNIGDVAWYRGNSDLKSHPVGTRTANVLGLHDMSGNFSEFCWDLYQENYHGLSMRDPTGPVSGSTRVIRGGNIRFKADFCRVGYRAHGEPQDMYTECGFRVVLAPQIEGSWPEPMPNIDQRLLEKPMRMFTPKPW